ncbi:metalloendopeptidase-like membrane protein [Desulfitobacterium dichloroeliminans LMG P-21439]|uniref:Metalloendopeptidase-like membrane protein n=1 Tax=Desulfitobacterium dichloroeliminans (strain LMG P-21439 / DCA1) TaxID=871963 RepID=L0F9S3_DESDL|nr:M23 family metallopeptidase [Desulfitobacterium dichloroeliminans]AGA70549.1 metalloendopeptidase-like membrane protein [Desulfitobacterium dichloroeliminans LMG P-21439]
MKNKYTFLMIPPDHGPTKQFQVTHKGKQLIISGICTLSLLFVGMFSFNLYLSKTVDSQEAQLAAIEELKQENLAKDQEIAQLKAQSQQVVKDMATMQELELRLTSILKIDPAESSTFSTTGNTLSASSTISRGAPAPTTPAPTISDPQQISRELKLLENYYALAVEHQEEIDRTPSILPLKVDFDIASEFGYRRNPFGGWSKEFHNGVDMPCDYGTEVYATASGIVTVSTFDRVYGRLIEIDHGRGVETIYAHNSRLLVKVGDKIEKGELIAYSGNSGRSTGSHLHYGARINGVTVDPLQFTDFTKEQ